VWRFGTRLLSAHTYQAFNSPNASEHGKVQKSDQSYARHSLPITPQPAKPNSTAFNIGLHGLQIASYAITSEGLELKYEKGVKNENSA
jgi:hypothetical protein